MIIEISQIETINVSADCAVVGTVDFGPVEVTPDWAADLLVAAVESGAVRHFMSHRGPLDGAGACWEAEMEVVS